MEDANTLVWVDQGRSLVRELAAGSVIARGFAAGGMVRTHEGALLLTGPDGLARLSLAAGLQRLPLGVLDQGACLNDACAGPNGELWAGVMSLSADATTLRSPGALVRIAMDGTIATLDADIGLPNGMGLSPEGHTLYVVDSVRRTVLAYPTAQLSRAVQVRGEFARFSIEDGVPDGLAVDASGYVWVALWYGGQVVRLSPSGHVDLRIPLPFAQISSLAFGGADGCDLYVTTAASPWRSRFAPPGWSDRLPQGGPLLRLRTAVPGAPLRRVQGY